MECKYFGKCGSCTLWQLTYKEQLETKTLKIKEEFKEFYSGEITIFSSNPSHFRNRAEFRVWHSGDKISYAMNGFDKKEIILINECQIVQMPIFEMMPKLINYIEKSPILKDKLFGIEFLNGENLLIALIYHKKIDDDWLQEGKKLENTLDINILGRSRGIRLVSSKDYILQKLKVLDSEYHYKVYENSFLQPNTKVNEKMITWAKKNSFDFSGDLLELYCGHGNFTIPLSENFDKVLATEISKKSIKAAKENVALNHINNISFVRLSSEELTQALNGKREFRRLKDIELKEFNFTTVFVDPPRAGVDEDSLKLLQKFEHIIYISCNPSTLKRDLKTLCKTHKIDKFALFDQFAFTSHIECGVILSYI